MTTIALVGAGGKMGCRLTDNFIKSEGYVLHYLEISSSGIGNLRERNLVPADETVVIPAADVVILAVPDTTIGAISGKLIPLMKPGALVMTLD
ncbi:MAG: semialdehyde dehydrogenase, partial [Sphingobacteriales bacterium]